MKAQCGEIANDIFTQLVTVMEKERASKQIVGNTNQKKSILALTPSAEEISYQNDRSFILVIWTECHVKRVTSK